MASGNGQILTPGARLAALLVLAAPILHAQQVFRSGVAVVVVDVVVLDKSGTPVTDLTAADFTVLARKQPRRLLSVEYVRTAKNAGLQTGGAAGPVGAAGLQTGGAEPVPSPSSNAPPATAGRTIIFAVDVDEIRAGEGRGVMKDIANYLDRLGPQDRVGLVSLPYGTPRVDVTSDFAQIKAATAKIAGSSNRARDQQMTYGEAAGVARFDTKSLLAYWERRVGSGQPGERCPPPIRRPFEEPTAVPDDCVTVAERALDGHRRHTSSILDALGAMATSMSPIAGPKALVLVSEGIFNDPGSATDLADFARKTELARVSLYSLHLDAPLVDASGGSSGNTVLTRGLDDIVGMDSMAEIAHAARGTAFRVVGSAMNVLQQIDRELSGYYLLSFEREPIDKDNARVGIEVKVNRPGLDVRARKEFTPQPATTTAAAPTPPKDPRAAMGELLKWPASIGDVRVAFDTFAQPVADNPKSIRTLIVAEIADDGKPLAAIGYEIRDSAHKIVADTLDIPPDVRRLDPARSLYIVQQPLPPGDYRIKFGVVDKDGRRGSVEHGFTTTAWPIGLPRVSDLMIGDISTNVFRPVASVPPGAERMGARLEVQVDSAVTFDGLEIELLIERRGQTEPVERRPVGLPAGPNPLQRTATTILSILDYPPGQYVVTAILRTPGGELARRHRGFTR